MRCAGCGGSITATEKFKQVKSTGEIKSYTYYHCSHKVPGYKNCAAPPIPKKELEAQVADIVKSHSIGEEFYKFGMKILATNEGHSAEIRKDVLLKQHKNIEDLEKKSERLLSLLLNDTISEKRYTLHLLPPDLQINQLLI